MTEHRLTVANQQKLTDERIDDIGLKLFPSFTLGVNRTNIRLFARACIEAELSARQAQPHELPPSLALRAWTALSEVDYEFDPPQRVVDLMYELQLVAQGRCSTSSSTEKKQE